MAKKIEPSTAWSDRIPLTAEDWVRLEEAGQISFDNEHRAITSTIIDCYYADYCAELYAVAQGKAKKTISHMRKKASDLFLMLKDFDIFDWGDPKIASELSAEDLFAIGSSDDLLKACRQSDYSEDNQILDDEIDEYIKNQVKNGHIRPENAAIARIIDDHYECLYGNARHFFINDVRSMLSRFDETLASVLAVITVERGSCGDERANAFLHQLHAAFSKATNPENPAVSVQFLTFAKAVCKIIAERSNYHFGKEIRTRIMYLNDDAIRKRIAAHRLLCVVENEFTD